MLKCWNKDQKIIFYKKLVYLEPLILSRVAGYYNLNSLTY
jgi:hypothetical protein